MSRLTDLTAAVDAVMDVMDKSCHHCGRMPEQDDDHTCLCPDADAECFTHLADPVVSRNAIRDALFPAEPGPGCPGGSS